jgi:hypothetical protein
MLLFEYLELGYIFCFFKLGYVQHQNHKFPSIKIMSSYVDPYNMDML